VTSLATLRPPAPIAGAERPAFNIFVQAASGPLCKCGSACARVLPALPAPRLYYACRGCGAYVGEATPADRARLDVRLQPPTPHGGGTLQAAAVSVVRDAGMWDAMDQVYAGIEAFKRSARCTPAAAHDLALLLRTEARQLDDMAEQVEEAMARC